jgi:hypothetical protein
MGVSTPKTEQPKPSNRSQSIQKEVYAPKVEAACVCLFSQGLKHPKRNLRSQNRTRDLSITTGAQLQSNVILT